MSVEELKDLLKGSNLSSKSISEILSKIDSDNSGLITFDGKNN
jgi:hypothetical protein